MNREYNVDRNKPLLSEDPRGEEESCEFPEELKEGKSFQDTLKQITFYSLPTTTLSATIYLFPISIYLYIIYPIDIQRQMSLNKDLKQSILFIS